MPDKINMHKKKNLRDNYLFVSFFTGMVLSFLIFIPFIIRDGGRFLFYGDFNVQQVAFYRLAHDAVRSGNLGWSHLTDLGANFVGSYSFYLLGSPFFWLTIPFPSEWLQYLMGPLFILKFSFASMTAYIYLHRYLGSRNVAVICSLLYAFSGFSVYNIFFFHFHEAIIVFPLLLASLDAYIYEHRHGIFALSCALAIIVNYYFFVGMAVFTLIYFIIRVISHSYKVTAKECILLVLEAFIGLFLSAFILWPSVLTVMQNSRVLNPINGWGAILYTNTQKYLHILQSMFFMPDLPARPNFTPNSEAKWASLGAWLPLFGMTGVIGFLQLHKKSWLKKLIYTLFLMALIPALNSAFQLFNAAYYARWYYMLTLMMALATGFALESTKVNWKRSIKWTAVITTAVIVLIGTTPTITTSSNGLKSVTLGLENNTTRFWSYAAVSLLCLAVLSYIFVFVRNKKRRYRILSIVLSIITVLYSIFFIAIGKTQSDDPYDHLIPYALNGGADLPMNGLDSVRSDFYESTDNSAMFWEIPSIQAFHSIVPGSVMDFYKFIGVERDVASRPDTTHYALRGLTSVRWLFDDEDDNEMFSSDFSVENAKMPGWIFYGTANGFDIWENEFYIPMGFSYDKYVTYSEASHLTETQREMVMLKALIVPDDKAEMVSDILEHFNLAKVDYTIHEYETDCLDRTEYVCDNFIYTKTGFDASISSDTERIIFFSVPYEEGWSAAVNGEHTDIIKSNVGFMAVRIPSGSDVRITFTYRTPGLHTGTTASVLALIILITYIAALILVKKNTHEKKTEKRSVYRVQSFAVYRKKTNTQFKTKYKGKYMLTKKIVTRTLCNKGEK